MIEWLKPRAVKNISKADVTLAMVSNGKDANKRMYVSFRNFSASKFTKSKYFAMGLENGKLYFKDADKLTGWTLSSYSKDNSICHSKVSTDILEVKPNGFELGDYNLQFDSKYNLFYIDVRNKLHAQKETN